MEKYWQTAGGPPEDPEEPPNGGGGSRPKRGPRGHRGQRGRTGPPVRDGLPSSMGPIGPRVFPRWDGLSAIIAPLSSTGLGAPV